MWDEMLLVRKANGLDEMMRDLGGKRLGLYSLPLLFALPLQRQSMLRIFNLFVSVLCSS